MLIVATCFWDPTPESMEFSRCYSEAWVEKLYRGFKRNLTKPFRFVCFVDRERKFKEPIEQMPLEHRPIGYGSCIEPFKLNEPMIFCGLDTVIVGNCDKFANYCLEGRRIALPKHPFEELSINGVVLCPAGQRHIFDDWRGENDMEWMRQFPHDRLDEIWPGKIISYRGHVRGRPASLNKARIIYFHGRAKAHELPHESFVRQHWV
jgi:hypothetical protein